MPYGVTSSKILPLGEWDYQSDRNGGLGTLCSALYFELGTWNVEYPPRKAGIQACEVRKSIATGREGDHGICRLKARHGRLLTSKGSFHHGTPTYKCCGYTKSIHFERVHRKQPGVEMSLGDRNRSLLASFCSRAPKFSNAAKQIVGLNFERTLL
jgi:hypothetical protein